MTHYKSKFEHDVAEHLPIVDYEPDKFSVTIQTSYIPDFKIGHNKYLEVKGRFRPEDRRKIVAFMKQHPEVKLHFVFYNNAKIGTKQTHLSWCKKHNIPAVVGLDNLPAEWFK